MAKIDKDTTRLDMLNAMENSLQQAKDAKIKNTIVSHGWVVFNPETKTAMGYRFEKLANGRRQAVDSWPANITNCDRFTKEDAQTMAENTFCGKNDTPAVAMFINDAADRIIENLENSITIVKELLG